MKHHNIHRRLIANEDGATAVEYGLILALLVIAITASLRGVGNGSDGLWATVENKATAAMGGSGG